MAILKRTGAQDYVRGEAHRWRDEAIAALDVRGPAGGAREARPDHAERDLGVSRDLSLSDGLPALDPPAVGRPDVPTYGIPETLDGMLPWSWAEERLARAETYWIATTRSGGRPHLMPVWAAWHAGRLWFEGGATTRRARNLEQNPAVSVGIELPGDGAVVVEGDRRAPTRRDVPESRAPSSKRSPSIPCRRAATSWSPFELVDPGGRDLGDHAPGRLRLDGLPGRRHRWTFAAG